LTRWKELDDPLLEVGDADIVAGRDNTGLVYPAVELNDDLARSVIIHFLELANVTMFLHHTQELDDDLRAGPDENLSFPSLFGVIDRIESIVKNAGLDHCGGLRFSTRSEEVRYLHDEKQDNISHQES